MRSFASPAARVLRSVRSRWQTGWRSARALAMITRYRIFITAALACHLLLASGIVTSQTLPPAAATVAGPETAPTIAPTIAPTTTLTTDNTSSPATPVHVTSSSQAEEDVTMRAVQQ